MLIASVPTRHRVVRLLMDLFIVLLRNVRSAMSANTGHHRMDPDRGSCHLAQAISPFLVSRTPDVWPAASQFEPHVRRGCVIIAMIPGLCPEVFGGNTRSTRVSATLTV